MNSSMQEGRQKYGSTKRHHISKSNTTASTTLGHIASARQSDFPFNDVLHGLIRAANDQLLEMATRVQCLAVRAATKEVDVRPGN
jgi:hypothetical protein